jgi:hypothetical protein
VEAEWFGAEQAVALGDASPPKTEPNKRDGVLRLQAADDVPTRRSIEEVLESHTKRWALQGGGIDQDGRPELAYAVRLKKRVPPEPLLEALRERLGEPVAEYTPMKPDRHGRHDAT